MQWSFFRVLVSSTVTEIKILLIDQILDHFVHHPVLPKIRQLKGHQWFVLSNHSSYMTSVLLGPINYMRQNPKKLKNPLAG
jgi:hypothetical protein